VRHMLEGSGLYSLLLLVSFFHILVFYLLLSPLRNLKLHTQSQQHSKRFARQVQHLLGFTRSKKSPHHPQQKITCAPRRLLPLAIGI
jgi:hypothetical protein